MGNLYKKILFLLAVSVIAVPIPASAGENSESGEMLLAQNKKASSRGGKSRNKTPGTTPETEEASGDPGDGTEPDPESTSGPAKQSRYVYHDSLLGAPAFYNVEKAYVTKTQAEIDMSYSSSSAEIKLPGASGTKESSGQGVFAELIVPFSKMIVAGLGSSYQTAEGNEKIGGEFTSLSSKYTTTQMSFPAYVTTHLTPNIDAGIRVDYHAAITNKVDDLTTTYSFVTFTPALGVHSNKYEVSFGYTPLAKVKAKVSGEDMETELESPSRMRFSGRFLVVPGIFLGAGHEAESNKETSRQLISMEAGLKGREFQMAGGLNLLTSNTKYTGDETTIKTTGTGFQLEAATLDHARQPKLSVSLTYAPAETKQGESITKTTEINVKAGAKIRF